jgi:hypothetical protein
MYGECKLPDCSASLQSYRILSARISKHIEIVKVKNNGFHTILEAIVVAECLEIFSVSHVNIKCMSNVSKNLSACFIMLVLHDGGRDGL